MIWKGTTAMHHNPPRRRPGRRGVTLVEMLVTVALVVLIMTIVVNVFRSATGAVRGVQINQEFEVNLRRLEATIRQDLAGATARFTPPLNPKDGLGYFELGENSFADAQGEDTDDWMAFTVKAPIGQPFQGRYWDPNGNQAIQPTIITSEFAEVIYFLRDGNLYRRVLLIVPEKAGNLASLSTANIPYTLQLQTMFASGITNGLPISWLGGNDISARPARWLDSPTMPAPNSLGDLTNRENRAFRPRFDNDYDGDNIPDEYHGGPVSGTNSLPNGILDEYPTLYPNIITTTKTSTGSYLLNETHFTRLGNPGLDGLPFPYIFPGSYSVPDYPYVGAAATLPYGQIHAIGTATPVVNHSPLEVGDNLAVPTTNLQTYWGWPTWKETASPNWTDPWIRLFDNGYKQSPGLSILSTNAAALPPMTTGVLGSSTVPYRPLAQPFNDAAGSSTFALLPTAAAPFTYTDTTLMWNNAWEDDLIMTGVRSFDIKVYDPNAAATGLASVPGYHDLGYAASNWLSGFGSQAQSLTGLPTFGHEGRIPPIQADFRPDAQWPGINPNVGENENTTVRLRRVWDSWSTEYTNAPDLPLDPTQGPLNGQYPVYPSYPAPYPAPLRAIQIQIRLTNTPDNDHVKALTITQDFSDKL